MLENLPQDHVLILQGLGYILQDMKYILQGLQHTFQAEVY